MCGWAKILDIPASHSFGVRIYCKNAALCQQPSAWIMESSTPIAAAVVAALMQKL